MYVRSFSLCVLNSQETRVCNLPSIGIVDSDCDPSLFTYPVPANDDTEEATRFYLKHFVAAIREGKVTCVPNFVANNLFLTLPASTASHNIAHATQKMSPKVSGTQESEQPKTK